MKPNIILIMILASLSILTGCQKDPLDDVNSGTWNKERNIIDITFDGQVGDITRARAGDSATISFICNTAAVTDLSKVKIASLELSYGASASVSKDQTVDFSNDSHTATITVKAAHGGGTLDWIIKLVPFKEDLLGTWKISGLYVYGGTGAVYGGSSLAEMIKKSWCWDAKTGPAAELDNTLTFTLSGVTKEGNSYGTVVNNPGNDGLNANFIYTAKTPNIDVNKFYRKIPTGTGTWIRDYSAGTVSFTFEDGTTTTTCIFASAGSENIYGSIVKTITDHSLEFSLKGADDWNNIYTDYDRFVSNPSKFWIDINKQ